MTSERRGGGLGVSKAKRFEELSEAQKAAFHNMDTPTLFRLHNSLKVLVEGGVCKPKLYICAQCPFKKETVRLVGYGGPMACSLIMLEAASRGRYVPITAVEEVVCDQCGRRIPPKGVYVKVPQMGYRDLNFCVQCVERSRV